MQMQRAGGSIDFDSFMQGQRDEQLALVVTKNSQESERKESVLQQGDDVQLLSPNLLECLNR